jgi:hypothetical protein
MTANLNGFATSLSLRLREVALEQKCNGERHKVASLQSELLEERQITGG